MSAKMQKFVKITAPNQPDRTLNENEGATATWQIVAKTSGKATLQAWLDARRELKDTPLPSGLTLTAYKERKSGDIAPVASMTSGQLMEGLALAERYANRQAELDQIRQELETLRTRYITVAAAPVSAKGLANVLASFATPAAAEPASEPTPATPKASPRK